MTNSLCRNCGQEAPGKYCAICGNQMAVPAITIHGIVHEVVHHFTHLDKGFGFTLKKLITQPGKMQRDYIDGDRSRNQKPFSMFFICGTISGLGYYLVNVAFGKIYGKTDFVSEDFFRHYFVLLQALLLPLYTLVTWLSFKNKRYSYAETLVMMLYNLSLVFLVLVPIIALTLMFPRFDTRIIEIIFLLIYNFITNLNFYEGKKPGIVLRTVLAIGACYVCSQLFSELVRGFL